MDSDIIAKFQDNRWTRYGSLKTSRRFHGSIQSDDQTMIIGGASYSLVQIKHGWLNKFEISKTADIFRDHDRNKNNDLNYISNSH